MKKVMGVAAAALAFAAAPVAPALAQGGAQCIDVVVSWELLGGGVGASAPYECGCGPVIKNTAIVNGTVYTINLGCPRF